MAANLLALLAAACEVEVLVTIGDRRRHGSQVLGHCRDREFVVVAPLFRSSVTLPSRTTEKGREKGCAGTKSCASGVISTTETSSGGGEGGRGFTDIDGCATGLAIDRGARETLAGRSPICCACNRPQGVPGILPTGRTNLGHNVI